MQALAVSNLNKKYKSFSLENVSFTLKKGYIMGFIGRNGAGKTTTLKSMLNLVHADSGSVAVLGQDFFANELSCKQKMGIVFGGFTHYPKKRVRTITEVTSRFYSQWDEALYRSYLSRFEIDENKHIDELSEGMKVKYALALALSHNAQVLVLDEPTSGMDPVSRDDLLELFQELIESGEKSILFSTHITSDLEKCADYITYIKKGKIIASRELEDFLCAYKLIKGTKKQSSPQLQKSLIGYKENAYGFSGLAESTNLPQQEGLEVMKPDLDTIMIYMEREKSI